MGIGKQAPSDPNDGRSSSHSGNAFDFLRLAAAYAVLVSHNYLIFGLDEPRPVTGYKLGGVAVFVFFSLSGFLVSQSWVRDPNGPRFALRRGLRIFPGLAVMLLMMTFVLGPGLSQRPFLAYVNDGGTWVYFFRNLITVASDISLPGVFDHNPERGVINGSLWTLRYELLMYVLLAMTGKLVPRSMLAGACSMLFVGLAGLFLMFELQHIEHWTVPIPLIWHIGLFFDAVEIARLGAFFFGGCCLYFFRDRITWSWWWALGLAVAAYWVGAKWLTTIMLWFAIPYVTILSAYHLPRFFRKIGQRGDASYGIYIYAFPIQQAVASYLIPQGYSATFGLFVSSVLTLLLAQLSWHWIEKPALNLKFMLLSSKRQTSGCAVS